MLALALTPRHSSREVVSWSACSQARRCSRARSRQRMRVARLPCETAARRGPAARVRARGGARRALTASSIASSRLASLERGLRRLEALRSMRASRLRVGVAGQDAVADRDAELELHARRRRAPIRWRRSRSDRSRRGSPRRARPARRNRRSARGAAARAAISSAPGTVTTVMSSSATPRLLQRAQRAGEQPVADRGIEARQRRSPTRRPSPRDVRRIAIGMQRVVGAASHDARRRGVRRLARQAALVVAGHLEVEARHARHLARPARAAASCPTSRSRRICAPMP